MRAVFIDKPLRVYLFSVELLNHDRKVQFAEEPMHLDFGSYRSRSLGSMVALFLFGVLAPNVTAHTVAFSPSGTAVIDVPFPVNLGLVFTAQTNFSIDALGFYYGSGVSGPEMVGLYNSSGILLASATVLLSDPVVNGYLFHSIVPVALTAGQQYT